MNLTIEKARPEDAADTLDHLRQVGGETDNLTFGAEGVPFTVEEEAAYIRSLEDSSSTVMYIARLDGRVVGNGTFSAPMRQRLQHRGKVSIAVMRDVWGLGVGTALMSKIIAFAKDTANAEILHLEVRSDNHRAIQLYKKFGFQKTGVCHGMMKINGMLIDCDMMELHL